MKTTWWKVVYKDRKEHQEAELSWSCQAESEDAARDAWSVSCPGDEIIRVEEWPCDPTFNAWLYGAGKQEYPKHALSILSIIDDRVTFAPLHGGRSFSGPLDQFLRDFRLVTEEEREAANTAFLAVFSLDWGPHILGFSWGQRWNGWGDPTLEKESLKKWMTETLDGEETCTLEWVANKLIHVWEPYDDDDPGREEIEPRELVHDGKTYTVYDVGLSWCWTEYNQDDLERLPEEELEEVKKAILPVGMAGNPTEMIK